MPIAADPEYAGAVSRFMENERGLSLSFPVDMPMYSDLGPAIMDRVGAAANIVVITTAASLPGGIRHGKQGRISAFIPRIGNGPFERNGPRRTHVRRGACMPSVNAWPSFCGSTAPRSAG